MDLQKGPPETRQHFCDDKPQSTNVTCGIGSNK